MTLSKVHDTQFVYRKLLDCMSRPGKVQSIHHPKRVDSRTFDCYPGTTALLFTLLDQEATYYIVSKSPKEIEQTISSYTLAQRAPLAEADFIIVLADASALDIEQALQQCKIGTLRDPHVSATWIIESKVGTGKELLLTGPGVKTENSLKIDMSARFWELRQERLSEFPLGFDIILTNEAQEIACVPRTTKVESVVFS